jgi:hydrogenase maturation protease
MNGDVLIVGIGNEYRGDDGVGLAVAAAVAERQLQGVRVMNATGEPASILDAWAGVALAVVVDAAVGEGSTPGRIRRWTPGREDPPTVVSSHSFGLAQTLELGQAVGRLPQKVVVFTVDIEHFDHGVGLTAAVANAVPAVVDDIIAELEKQMA